MTRGRYMPGHGPHVNPIRSRGHYNHSCGGGHCHHGHNSLGNALKNAAGIALTAYAVRSLTGYNDWGCHNCARGRW